MSVLCTIVGVHEGLTKLKLLGGCKWEEVGGWLTGSNLGPGGTQAGREPQFCMNQLCVAGE